MKTIPRATTIALTAEERSILEMLNRSTKTEVRMRDRARMALLAAGGTATREIGRLVGHTTGTVSKWRVRYACDRLAGLDETGNRGATPKYGPAEQKRILALLDQPPPAGYSNWTAPLLARALCDVHEQYIWRFLRAQKIDLSGRKSWCESTDPAFVAKAAEILAPPRSAARSLGQAHERPRRSGPGPRGEQGNAGWAIWLTDKPKPKPHPRDIAFRQRAAAGVGLPGRP
jgi:transposase